MENDHGQGQDRRTEIEADHQIRALPALTTLAATGMNGFLVASVGRVEKQIELKPLITFNDFSFFFLNDHLYHDFFLLHFTDFNTNI